MAERSELPLVDYDHLPVNSLAHRIRSLSFAELGTLLDYERHHANRVPVIELLEARRDQLAGGASPSGGDGAERPEQSADSRHGSPVGPETASEPHEPQRHARPDQTPRSGRP